KRLLAADNTQVERPVAPQIFLDRMDANRFHVGIAAILARAWHTVLADEDHEVGAHYRVGRKRRRESMIVGEMAARGPRGNNRDLVFLSGLEKWFPGLILKHALARDQQGTLRAGDQIECLLDLRGRRTGARLGAVFVFAVIVLQFRRVGESG